MNEKSDIRDWENTTIGELPVEIIDGDRSSRYPKRHELVDHGIPFLSTTNICDNRLELSDVAFITPSKFAEFSKGSLRRHDVILTTRGSVGKTAYYCCEYDVGLINAQMLILRADPKRMSPRYLFYLLASDCMQKAFANYASGSAQPQLPIQDLRAIEVVIPPFEIQRKIGFILSAYDDLIENNLRRIAILEEMARAIYREWFVEFRYPGRGSEPLVESQAGPIPRDWQSGPIGSLVETTGGGTPSTSRPEYWEDGDITWYTPSDLTANDAMFITRSSRRITELGLRGSSAKLFPPYSVMMTSRATIGVVSIATTEACTNQGFITCIPNDSISSYHLYFWLLENQQTIASFASGATFKEISRTVFRRLPIAVPPKDVAKAFVKVVDPVAKLVEVLLKQDLVLRNTRDLLLPRLISGELDVSNITIDAEEDHL